MSPASRARIWMAITFCLISLLVIGGLAWVTVAALRLELSDQMRLALWRLDSRVSPSLAREDSRPYQHFDALYIPLPALQRNYAACSNGSVLVPSPLLSASVPNWMLLHWQTTAEGAWRSPQVLSQPLFEKLHQPSAQVDLTNVTPERAQFLDLMKHYAPETMIARLPAANPIATVSDPANSQPVQSDWALNQQAAQMKNSNRDNDLEQRGRVQQAAKEEARGGPGSQAPNYKVAPIDSEITLRDIDAKFLAMNPTTPLSAMIGDFKPLWLRAEGQPDELVIARRAQLGETTVVQGVLLDWEKLRSLLLSEISDLFPQAQLDPVFSDTPESPERLMTVLPVQLNPGPLTAQILPGWSPMRTGLLLAWIAALGALTVVGFGGWSLMDLSERRFRFVSAVTHELRTPLTTLRLYLDMLTGGLIRDDKKKDEYLHTLHGESDRLHRLVSNVLDFARLERQRPKLALKDIAPRELIDQVNGNWRERCKAAGKELVVESNPDLPSLRTDPELVQQILGNLIDNACKYSRDATDERIWLRANRDGPATIFEVEDRGPGISPRERQTIFQAFRRGYTADVTAGGVGLGLALARRWAQLLGGQLDVSPGRDDIGARFQLRL
jgi:signal transduction histidine kinase